MHMTDGDGVKTCKYRIQFDIEAREPAYDYLQPLQGHLREFQETATPQEMTYCRRAFKVPYKRR